MEKIICITLSSIMQGISSATIIKAHVEKMSRKQFIALSILIGIYSCISLLYITNQLRLLITLLVFVVTIMLVMKRKEKIVILYSINTVIILSIAELLATILLVALGFDSSKIVLDYKYNVLTNFFVSTIGMLIVSIPIFRRLIKKIIRLFEKNKRLLQILNVIIVLVYLLVLKNGFELILTSNYYINILLVIVLLVILMIIIKNESNTRKLNEEYKQMLNYVTKYERIITEQGKANHEFKNQLLVIRGYAQMNNMTKMMSYLDSIIEDQKKIESNYLIRELNKFPDGGIKGLLYYKLTMMEEEKIKHIIEVEKGVKTELKGLEVQEYKNITKILGVLIDNAIEEVRKAKEKEIIISVIKEGKNIEIVISNTYKGKIDLEKIGTGYTSKGKNRGYGLRLVKDIVENKSKYEFSNYLENKYYVSKLVLKTKDIKKIK